MRAAGFCAAVVAVSSILGLGTAWAACPVGLPRGCIVNLGLTPQASQQIVGGDPASPTPARKINPNEPASSYTGPTIGTAPNLQRAPEIGYRWAIN